MARWRVSYLSRYGYEVELELESDDWEGLVREGERVLKKLQKQGVLPCESGRRPPRPPGRQHEPDDKAAIRQVVRGDLAKFPRGKAGRG